MEKLPVSFMTRLAQTPHALRIFSAFDETQRQRIVNKAQSITSKEDMDALISGIMRYNLN